MTTTTTEKYSEATTEPDYENFSDADWDEYNRIREERRDREGEYLDARGPLSLLQAVYCDPCKAKVSCSFFTKINFMFSPISLKLIISFRCFARS